MAYKIKAWKLTAIEILNFLLGKLALYMFLVISSPQSGEGYWMAVAVHALPQELTLNALEVFRIRALGFLCWQKFNNSFSADGVSWADIKNRELDVGPGFHTDCCPLTSC